MFIETNDWAKEMLFGKALQRACCSFELRPNECSVYHRVLGEHGGIQCEMEAGAKDIRDVPRNEMIGARCHRPVHTGCSPIGPSFVLLPRRRNCKVTQD